MKPLPLPWAALPRPWELPSLSASTVLFLFLHGLFPAYFWQDQLQPIIFVILNTNFPLALPLGCEMTIRNGSNWPDSRTSRKSPLGYYESILKFNDGD